MLWRQGKSGPVGVSSDPLAVSASRDSVRKNWRIANSSPGRQCLSFCLRPSTSCVLEVLQFRRPAFLDALHSGCSWRKISLSKTLSNEGFSHGSDMVPKPTW